MTKKELFQRDYRDICYFIDHVKNIKLRISILEQLGYKIGVNIVNKDSAEKKITIGKRKEKRIQISPNIPKSPLVPCVVLELS